jgi:hypothetical protein
MAMAGPFALAVFPLLVVAWLAVGGNASRRINAAARLPVRPSLDLLERPLCRLRGLRITEVVAWRDDLLVGYEGGDGAWPIDTVGHSNRWSIQPDLHDVSGQLLLAFAGRDPKARVLLDEWRRAAISLTSVISSDRLLVALVHEPSCRAVVSRA